MLVERVVRSAASPFTTTGSRAPTTSRKAASSLAVVRYWAGSTGAGAGAPVASRRWTVVPKACSFVTVAKRSSSVADWTSGMVRSAVKIVCMVRRSGFQRCGRGDDDTPGDRRLFVRDLGQRGDHALRA